MKKESNKLEDYGDVLCVKDLFHILPLGRNTIYSLLNDHTIKHINVGNKIIIPKKNLIEFLQNAN